MAVEIRMEKPDDIKDISRVVEAAFERPLEAQLVSAIRSRKQSMLSLVAIQDEQLVGHVLVSPITIMPPRMGNFGGVAPLSVSPQQQGHGIGSELMLAVIRESTTLGVDALFLLGSPNYYPRFSFAESHLENEYAATDAFMHLELVPGSLQSVSGLAKYVSAFNETGA